MKRSKNRLFIFAFTNCTIYIAHIIYLQTQTALINNPHFHPSPPPSLENAHAAYSNEDT